MRNPRLLKKSEFYDIYVISLLMNKGHDDILLPFILLIAKKYLIITNWAVRKEVNHICDGTLNDEIWLKELVFNKKLLKNMNVLTKNSNLIKDITLEQIFCIFQKCKWSCDYGGKRWAKITEKCIELKELIKNPNLNELVICLDQMNDLEHNNELYMNSFCSFNFLLALDDKFKIKPSKIINKCSKKVLSIYNQITYKTKSLVAKYHSMDKE